MAENWVSGNTVGRENSQAAPPVVAPVAFAGTRLYPHCSIKPSGNLRQPLAVMEPVMVPPTDETSHSVPWYLVIVHVSPLASG
ncbi:hypothetical protein D9M68_973730 [compost metagenome]